jgi:hypothetical protein
MQRTSPKHDQSSCICPECPQNANRPVTRSYRTLIHVTSQPKHHEQHCGWCELWDRFRADTVRWSVDEKPLKLCREADEYPQKRDSTAPSSKVVRRYLCDSRRERMSVRQTELGRLEDWSYALEWYER